MIEDIYEEFDDMPDIFAKTTSKSELLEVAEFLEYYCDKEQGYEWDDQMELLTKLVDLVNLHIVMFAPPEKNTHLFKLVKKEEVIKDD